MKWKYVPLGCREGLSGRGQGGGASELQERAGQLGCGLGGWSYQNDANKFIVMILFLKHRFLFYLYTDLFFSSVLLRNRFPSHFSLYVPVTCLKVTQSVSSKDLQCRKGWRVFERHGRCDRDCSVSQRSEPRWRLRIVRWPDQHHCSWLVIQQQSTTYLSRFGK